MGKGAIKPLPMFFDAVPVGWEKLGFVGHDIDVVALLFDDPDVQFRNDIFQRDIVEHQFKRYAFKFRHIGIRERSDSMTGLFGERFKL